MRSVRLLVVVALASALFMLIEAPSAGQGNPKAKPKPGAPLVHDPADLPKPGDPLSIRTPVQRPGPLKNVRSWTIETKRHRWYPTILALSPDNRHLATGGYDGIIRLWDVETGKFERALVAHDSYVYGLAFSPDGNYLASAGSFNATARIWDVKTGMPVRVLKGHKGYVSHVAWSPDGTKLLTAGGTSGFITLWDVVNSKQLETTEYGNPIYSISFSKSGEHVATSAAKAGTYIADSTTLKTLHSLKEALDDATAVSFSPDSKLLAAGSSKQTIVYDVESGVKKYQLKSPGYAIAWTPKTGLLVAPQNGAVIPHAPETLAPAKELAVYASAICLSSDGSQMFTLLSGAITHFDLEKKTVVKTIEVGEVQYPTWGNNRPLLLGLNLTKSPTLWDTATGKLSATLEGHTATVVSSAFAPSGRLVVTGAQDKTARVWESPGGKLLRTLAPHGESVTAVAIASDGKIATGSADRKVRIWPAMGDQPTQTLTDHKNSITALAWSRDNRTLASGGNDRQVILWAADTGKVIKTLEHPSEVQSLAFSANGDRIAVGSVDDRLRIYQVPTGKMLAELEQPGSPPNVSAVAWSPDGLFVLGGRGNHTLQTWNTKTNKMALSIGTMAPVTSVTFSTDGRTLGAASLDRSVRSWDAQTGRLKMTLIADKEQVLAIGADGNYRCPNEAESELVAVVQTDKGQETVSLKEFATKFGFRNSPGMVK
jgi:WD40 repeat protein